jgi:RpiB/LacA/LacB family sugar-phosphate isomerase
VYAALCYTKEAAVLSRQHNNANVLILGSNFISEKTMFDMIKIWLETAFEGGRHLRRIKQVKAMERKVFKSVQ